MVSIWHNTYLSDYQLKEQVASQKNVEQARANAFGFDVRRYIGMVSGGFDPLHPGHIEYIMAAAERTGRLWIVVNDDEWLIRKKGYAFLDQEARAKMIASLKFPGADPVVLIWNSEKDDVGDAIRILEPDVFYNGGDRNEDSSPSEEAIACKEVGAVEIFGCGGTDKKYSSSKLVENVIRKLNDGY